MYNSASNRVFRVIGDRLYTVTDNNTITDLGQIASGGSIKAAMPFSFNTQAVLLRLGDYYLYDYDAFTLTAHDSSFEGNAAIDMTWIDGYYFFTNGEFVYHTLALDETTIDPLGFNGAEISPDGIIGVSRSDDNMLIVWGRFTIEQFYNAANQEFVFTRSTGRTVNVGLAGTYLKAISSGNWYLIGS